MKSSLLAAASVFSLISTLSYAQSEEISLPPTEQELIERQTELGARRAKETMNQWGLFDIFKPRNQCKYAIQVPDSVTRGTIALTFDDGPNSVTTPKILDVLKAHNAKATFFVLGGKIKGHEALLQRIVDEGHHLGNHSYSHPNFHDLGSSKTENEVESTDKLLRQFALPTYFRYPYGNSTCNANDLISSLGYHIVGWDIDTCDWAYADGKVSDKENLTCMAPESLRNDYAGYVLREVQKTQGGVLLMHDIHQNTADSLDRLLTLLEEANYRFVALDDLNIFPRLNKK